MKIKTVALKVLASLTILFWISGVIMSIFVILASSNIYNSLTQILIIGLISLVLYLGYLYFKLFETRSMKLAEIIQLDNEEKED